MVEQLGEEDSGPPLGFNSHLGYGITTVSIDPGDTVVMYTDGISEATNSSGAAYGIKRVVRLVATGPRDVAALAGTLLTDVRRFTEGRPQTDDTCLLAFARNG